MSHSAVFAFCSRFQNLFIETATSNDWFLKAFASSLFDIEFQTGKTMILSRFSRHAHRFGALCVAIMIALSIQAPSVAQIGRDLSPHSDATLISENTSIRGGVPFTVALRIRMDAHWHSYWRNAGDSGLPTKIEWKLPAGFRAGEIQWPHPTRIETPPLVTYAYENEVWLLTQITPPSSLPSGKLVALRAKATWLVCKEECIPAQADVALTLPVAGAAVTNPRHKTAFAKWRNALPIAPTGWVLKAGRAADGKGFSLFVQAPKGREKALEGAHFFASDPSTIAHAAGQKMTRQRAGYVITLSPSEYLAASPKRLRGVLVASANQAWNDGGARALNVDVPLQSAAAFTSSTRSVQTNAVTAAKANTASTTLPVALGLALLGGLLLNLMPCVFPVLSLKVLSFVQQAGEDRSRVKKHGLAFGAGVLLSFWVLASVLLLVRASGASVGWGFQLQSPAFVAALSLLLFGVGLNLLGAFEIGVGLTNIGPKTALSAAQSSTRTGHAGYGASFWNGVLATVVATPCTAPFMGAALGFALSQPALPALLVFTALGLGMAAPYVLLSFNPSWLARLPRPGAWMETFKQAMALPIFATVVGLIWVFGRLTSVDGIALLAVALLMMGTAAWLWNRWDFSKLSPTARVMARGGALLSLGFALLAAWSSATVEPEATSNAPSASVAKAEWQPFSSSQVAQLQAQGRPVFIDFTAAWCITCQVNKRTTLAQVNVKNAFAQRDVVLMRADWTRRDAEITRALESYGRSGVPTYVLLPGKGGEPQILPEVLSESVVMNALEELPRLASRPADTSQNR